MPKQSVTRRVVPGEILSEKRKNYMEKLQQNSPASLVASGGTTGGSSSVCGSGNQNQLRCSGCGGTILDRFYLQALNKLWHEDCLKCACCDCRLGEVGSTCFERADLILCRRDYLRLFGSGGCCSSCNKPIPAFELVMRANGNVYHLECFNCHNCSYRFCVGDRFYLWNNRILCEGDYEDKLLSNGLPPLNTSGLPPHLTNGNIDHNTANSLRSCMPHSVIVPNNNHLSCIVNEPMDMNRHESAQFAGE